ncbi:E2 protein [Rusa timorensis papillomavirus 1]|uniref:Regulatory protein E2 n=1 Tax=Rusa timorensis papillomavirus 1 TaxID=2847277 RepID=A0A0X9JTY8_9PAPI|nr:E2 protein [Rusa timorensis papillomavirus 1]ALX18466.1 E2 protein [Rusa timorensis papillomavirus 1]
MATLNDRFDALQQSQLDIIEAEPGTLEDQIFYWDLLRQERVLQYYARKKGYKRLGMLPLPTLQISEAAAKEAIAMTLHLSSLKESSYANERWTLQDTSIVTFESPPQFTFKKGPVAVKLSFDGNPDNAVRHTLWRDIYYLDDDDQWRKTYSDVDSRGIYYWSGDSKVYYVEFKDDASLYSLTGQWEVTYNKKTFSSSIATSSTNEEDGPVPISSDEEGTDGHGQEHERSPNRSDTEEGEETGGEASEKASISGSVRSIRTARSPKAHSNPRSKSRSRSRSRSRSSTRGWTRARQTSSSGSRSRSRSGSRTRARSWRRSPGHRGRGRGRPPGSGRRQGGAGSRPGAGSGAGGRPGLRSRSRDTRAGSGLPNRPSASPRAEPVRVLEGSIPRPSSYGLRGSGGETEAPTDTSSLVSPPHLSPWFRDPPRAPGRPPSGRHRRPAPTPERRTTSPLARRKRTGSRSTERLHSTPTSAKKDPPVIIVRGLPNQLKTWRYRLHNRRKKLPFLYLSTTFSWVTRKGGDRLSSTRMLVAFASYSDRSYFLRHVVFPPGVTFSLGYFYGL